MQSPIIVFDHVNKTVTTILPGPAYEEKVAELAAVQRAQTSTAGHSSSS